MSDSATVVNAALIQQLTPHPLAGRVIVVAGAPASGKGTQCRRLALKTNLVHISTGDLFRVGPLANNSTLVINDVDCATWGHGLKGPGIGHEYFGPQRVLETIQNYDSVGFDAGLVDVSADVLKALRENDCVN